MKIPLEFKFEFECFYDKTTVKEIDDESTKDESIKKNLFILSESETITSTNSCLQSDGKLEGTSDGWEEGFSEGWDDRNVDVTVDGITGEVDENTDINKDGSKDGEDEGNDVSRWYQRWDIWGLR